MTDTFTLPQAAYPLNTALDPIKGDLFVTDAANLVVDVLNASSGKLLKTITGGRKPFESPAYAAILLPGKTALLSDDGLSVVVPVNEGTYAVGPALIGGSGSYGIAVNRSTRKIYVAESASGTVNVYTQ